MNLNETLSSNANSTVVDWHGGDGTVAATGVFSSGTVKLQSSIDGGSTYFDAKDGDGNALTLTADGAFSFSVGSCKLRANVSGATVAAGTAQVESISISGIGPAATAATATLTVYSLPVAGDVIRFTSPAFVRTSFTFVAGVAGAGQISIDTLTTPTLVAAAIAALTVTGLTETSSGPVVTITASTGGTSGNDWAVETIGGYAQAIAVLSGGRDAGTIATSGVIDVTLTSALIASSPLTMNVAVGQGDTLTVVADKIRNRLLLSSRIAPFYEVGAGFANTITLTKRAPFLANDATLNIALANGTPSPGITPVATSTNTTAGAATTPNIRLSIQRR